jgi:hypothetical protein
MYDIPAQTDGGQIQFCDAPYILDPSWDRNALDRLSPHKLWKLANLLVAFGYPDITAGLIETMRKAGLVAKSVEIGRALDWLVPPNSFGAETYAAYLNRFERTPGQFYPNSWHFRQKGIAGA